MREPKVRADGRCALKGCNKKLSKRALDHGDPFHSTECCRAFHRIQFDCDVPKKKGRKGALDRVKKA